MLRVLGSLSIDEVLAIGNIAASIIIFFFDPLDIDIIVFIAYQHMNEIGLYIIYSGVFVEKNILRWRTTLTATWQSRRGGPHVARCLWGHVAVKGDIVQAENIETSNVVSVVSKKGMEDTYIVVQKMGTCLVVITCCKLVWNMVAPPLVWSTLIDLSW